MSQSVRDFEKSFLADAAITAYTCVKVTSTGVDVATGDTDAIIGVAQNTVAIGETVTVRFAGTSKVIASTTVSAGALLTATTLGKVVTTTTDHKVVVGRALEASLADGNLIEILLTPGALVSL
jgi:hypothetical protein